MNLAEKLLQAKKDPSYTKQCFVGFDGFTDEIIDAVDTRSSLTDYQPMRQMEQFGGRVNEYAGKSCNIELVVRHKKIGGNAPILTNALLKGGHRITFAGAIGTDETIEPLFSEMADQCEQVIPLCPSGHSDAIEFHDGKVILGKHENLANINYQTLLKHLDRDLLTELLEQTDLFVSANWTMLPLMTELWQQLHKEIVPKLTDQPRWMFVDLADPAKRSDEDIQEALVALKNFQDRFQVILGLNEAEALRIGQVLGSAKEEPQALGADILELSGLHEIVIHSTRFAIGVNRNESITVDGPYTPTPVISTGAGDNFNAGFLNALLYELTLEERLLSGVATSGYYVRHGNSPSLQELATFLTEWKENDNVTA